MDFIVHIYKTLVKYDSILVIVYRSMKSTHFLLDRIDYKSQKLTRIYIKKIESLHGVPLTIIFDRDTKYTSIF